MAVTENGRTGNRNAVVYLPASYDQNNRYPLVVYLHSAAQAGTDVQKLYATGLPRVLRDGYRPSFDFVMIAVQSPAYSVPPAGLESILESASQRWAIDTARIYLTGIDAGTWAAYGSQVSISKTFAKKFAAIVAISGAAPQANENIAWWKESGTPLWAISGARGGRYTAQNGSLVEKLNEGTPGRAVHTVREGIGHGGWNDVYRGAVTLDGKTVWEWLYQFDRSKTFSKAHAGIAVAAPALSLSTATASTLPVTYTLKASGSQIYYPNGLGIAALKGGDTVNIPAGTYTLIALGNFKGAAGKPVVIRNLGGQVVTGEIRIQNDARYFKLLGNGKSGVTYGFKVSRTQYTGITVSKASDFEIGYCEVSGMTSGFFIKNNPSSTDPTTVYPAYVFKNIYIHHNYVHDVKNEGLYIGHTDPDGGQGGNPLIPVRMEAVEIAYNKVERTGWDGIQLANARSGNKIHHNTVTDYGTLNVSGQQAAIQIGSNTNVNIYDNTTKNGTGNGIQVFGYGAINIYNNVIENAAKDGSAKGRESIYCNPYLTGPEVNPKQQVAIYNNTIRYPQPFGAIRVGGIAANSLPSTIRDNKLLIPAAPANWQSIHTYSVVPGSTITGNTLITK